MYMIHMFFMVILILSLALIYPVITQHSHSYIVSPIHPKKPLKEASYVKLSRNFMDIFV
jgi:hypothetical protein